MPSLQSIATIIGLATIPLANGADWQTVQCSNPSLVNAAINPATRWSAADADTAWKAAVSAWNGGAVAPGDIALGFAGSVSNTFHGPDQWKCTDMGDIPCSGVVQCSSTNHPAGWLILDSFSSLHQFHQHVYNAIQAAETSMTPNIGTFAQTFAPQVENDDQLLSDLLAGLVDIVGIGSAFAWNVAIKEAKIFTNDNYRGFWKDVFNGQISFASAVAKNHLPAAESALGTQNSVSSAFGSVAQTWLDIETDVLKQLFSGDSGSIGNLTELIQGGMMSQVPNNVDLSNFTAEAEKILYGQMMPIAWSIAPGKLRPIILQTSEPCSSKATGVVSGFMTDDTAAQTHVCYGGSTFYLVNAHHDDNGCHAKECIPAPDGGDMQFQKLPGGTNNVLSGGNFGDVRVDDIVISSYQGYQLNGNKNGYTMPALSSYIDGNGTQGDFTFQNGIQTPGFFKIPICRDVGAAVETISRGPPTDDPNWPCGTTGGTPPNSATTGSVTPNPHGTNVHVNIGCININGNKECHPSSFNAAAVTSDTNSVTIYAKFDGNNKWDQNVTSGCQLDAKWPSNYGDVNFGADNCLYDAKGKRIDGQCCTAAPGQQIANPYYDGSPKPANPNPKGTNVHVNSGCISFGGTKRCHPDKYNVSYQNSDTSTVTIYAKFDGKSKAATVTPGCKLEAKFPASYSDVYFGADNCLYDGQAESINGQCCSETTTDQVPNPYL